MPAKNQRKRKSSQQPSLWVRRAKTSNQGENKQIDMEARSKQKSQRKTKSDIQQQKDESIHQQDDVEANFVEDQDRVFLRVQGGDPELLSEPAESDSEQSDSEIQLKSSQESSNNNATVSKIHHTSKEDSQSAKDTFSEGEIEEGMMEQDDWNLSQSSQRSNECNQAESQNNQVVMNEEEKTRLINDTIQAMMEQLMQQGRLVMEKETQSKVTCFSKGPNQNKGNNGLISTIPIASQPSHGNRSEVTIYDNAVRNEIGKRTSSLSEEAVDTSDDLMALPTDFENNQVAHLTNLLRVSGRKGGDYNTEDEQPQPSTSGEVQGQHPPTAHDRASELIKEAELCKAWMLDLPGKHKHKHINSPSSELLHSVVVDENYKVVASHIDWVTHNKIEKGEYVDFAKLIPSDRVMCEDDNKLQLVVKDGKIFHVPNNSGDSGGITSIQRWEQAFRVFSDIYL